MVCLEVTPAVVRSEVCLFYQEDCQQAAFSHELEHLDCRASPVIAGGGQKNITNKSQLHNALSARHNCNDNVKVGAPLTMSALLQ